jgi:hypothetical protein
MGRTTPQPHQRPLSSVNRTRKADADEKEAPNSLLRSSEVGFDRPLAAITPYGPSFNSRKARLGRSDRRGDFNTYSATINRHGPRQSELANTAANDNHPLTRPPLLILIDAPLSTRLSPPKHAPGRINPRTSGAWQPLVPVSRPRHKALGGHLTGPKSGPALKVETQAGRIRQSTCTHEPPPVLMNLSHPAL